MYYSLIILEQANRNVLHQNTVNVKFIVVNVKFTSVSLYMHLVLMLLLAFNMATQITERLSFKYNSHYAYTITDCLHLIIV